jgi:hypothetical protein
VGFLFGIKHEHVALVVLEDMKGDDSTNAMIERKWSWWFVFVCSICCLAMWCFVHRVFLPFQVAELNRQAEPHGVRSDLYPPWYGSRELLLHSRNPYSPEVTSEIFRSVYGRERSESDRNLPKDEARFSYPLFVAVLMSPTINLSFETVRRAFEVLLTVATLLSAILWIRVLNVCTSRLSSVAVAILSIGAWAAVEGVRLGQLTLLVGFFLSAAAAAYSSGRFGLSGFALGLAVIKPQLAIPLAGWLCICTFARWTERKAFLVFFLGTVGVLITISELLLHGWVPQWINTLAAYASYQRVNATVFSIFIGPVLGPSLALVIGIAIIHKCWVERFAAPGSEAFRVMIVIVISCTDILAPFLHYTNHILFIPLAVLVGGWLRTPRFSAEQKAVLLVGLVLLLGASWLITIIGCIGTAFEAVDAGVLVEFMYIQNAFAPLAALGMALVLARLPFSRQRAQNAEPVC